MATPPVTTFAETAALWHVLNQDYTEARRIAVDMLPNERREFADQLDRLRNMLGDECLSCGQLTPDSQMVTVNPLDPKTRRTRCKTCTEAGQ
jgi:hypothetical protein